MSHIIFFPSRRPLFLSREEKRTKNALKRERTSELIYKSRTFLSSSVVAFITIRSVLVVVRASEKEEHIGYIEESIQELILYIIEVLSALVPHHETTRV